MLLKKQLPDGKLRELRELEEGELFAFLIVWFVGVDEEFAEEVEEDIDHDAVASKLVLLAVADACGLDAVDVFVCYSHEAEALAWCEFADAELFALQFWWKCHHVVIFK